MWASQNRRVLVFGGAVGACLITTAVFLFGLGGWLAAWGGYVTYDTDYNLYLFQVFASERPAGTPLGVSTQVGLMGGGGRALVCGGGGGGRSCCCYWPYRQHSCGLAIA